MPTDRRSIFVQRRSPVILTAPLKFRIECLLNSDADNIFNAHDTSPSQFRALISAACYKAYVESEEHLNKSAKLLAIADYMNKLIESQY